MSFRRLQECLRDAFGNFGDPGGHLGVWIGFEGIFGVDLRILESTFGVLDADVGVQKAIFGALKAALEGLWGHLGGHLADPGCNLGAKRLPRASMVGQRRNLCKKHRFSIGF